MVAEMWNAAIQHWLTGAEKAPLFSSNYFFLSKTFVEKGNIAAGIIFGETFINLEPTTTRSREISLLLYKCWKDAIFVDGEGYLSIRFIPEDEISTPPAIISSAMIPILSIGEDF